MLDKKINLFLNSKQYKKFKLLAVPFSCIFIHLFVLIFAAVYHVEPLAIFNVASIFTYIVTFFMIEKHPKTVFYISFYEIVLHSFATIILIGNDFGFSMYFIVICPIAYNLLYSFKVKHPVVKACIMTFISFIFYVLCYIISEATNPVFQSKDLEYITPAIYILNIFFVFVVISISSLLFIYENEKIYNKLIKQNNVLDNLASKDTLTNLYNRRTMTSHIRELYKQYENGEKIFSIILCDIDDFKKCNDTHGHDMGDRVLVEVSKCLSQQIRDNDFLCRWGGEEFLIIVNNMDLETSRKIAERIRLSVSNLNIELDSVSIKVTLTLGVSSVSETSDYNDLFKLADQRLYIGKKQGKNKVV